MAKKSPPAAITNFLLVIIIFLVGIFYLLFLPETPQPSTGNSQVIIPLGDAKVKSPGDIQGGNNVSPQQPTKVKPADLQNLSF